MNSVDKVKICSMKVFTFIALWTFAFAQSSVWDTPEGRERIFEATVKVFKENYWDQDYIDWDQWAAQFRAEVLAVDNRDDFDSVMRQMVSHLNDQHSRWLGTLASAAPPLLERSLGTEQRFLPGSGLVIEHVFPQSPAQEQGLHRGDLITAINGKDIRQDSSYEVIQTFNDALGQTEVLLHVRRKQQRLSVRLSPRELDIDFLKTLPQAKMLSKDIGYVSLPDFTRANTARNFHQQLQQLQLQGAQKLILDLRDNPGGGLGELGLVMCAFLEGAWLQAMFHDQVKWQASCKYHNHVVTNTLLSPRGETLDEDSLDNASFFEGPLVVLVSQNNNSAGEVAALVLKYQREALVIGQQSLGNVEALQEFRLSDGSVVLVAVANLQGADGENFNRGITPDVVSKSHLSELARGFDAPIAEALKVIEALPFTPGKYF